ncbi:TPA: endonuclease VII domain-containing protein [Escherichia coli]
MSHYNRKRWADGHRPPSANPESRRAARVKHRYGITADEYNALLQQQGGRCAVCGEYPTPGNTRAHWDGKLCIDHDHETGRVRGLLCNDCNLAVGYGKSPDVLRRSADYLQRHS